MRNKKSRADTANPPDGRFAEAWKFLLAAAVLALVLAAPSLIRRMGAETECGRVAMLADYRDIASLAAQSGESREAIFGRLSESGVIGISAGEYTGRDLASGVMEMSFMPLAAIDRAIRANLDLPLGSAVMTLESSDPILPPLMDYLRARMPGVVKHVPGKSTMIILPHPYYDLLDAGVIPDFAALDFAQKNAAFIAFRPLPAPYADGSILADSLAWIKDRYPLVTEILPAGASIAGFPDIAPIVSFMKERGMSAAQAEFVRQIGSQQFFSAMNPNIIPLHSVTREEVISRRLSRPQLVERMIRAARERSIRLLLVRPYDLYSTARLEPFVEDTTQISAALRNMGYSIEEPRPFGRFGMRPEGALAVALVLLVLARAFVMRYLGRGEGIDSPKEAAALAALWLAIGAAILLAPFAARLAGALAAVFTATEAAIRALDRDDKPLRGIAAGFLTVLCGGLVIAGVYGTSDAMLRLSPFSGVKLTLLLPPILVLASDLRRRVHPETLPEIMNRPPLWGELAVIGALGIAALVVLLRSDNVSYVPGWEAGARDLLERLLVVRPRTKEFLIGYPCLMVYFSLARGGELPRLREIFRVGASIGFASAVNTFCHFHTALSLNVVRVVNGWWLGILIGLAALAAVDWVLAPFRSRFGRDLFGGDG